MERLKTMQRGLESEDEIEELYDSLGIASSLTHNDYGIRGRSIL